MGTVLFSYSRFDCSHVELFLEEIRVAKINLSHFFGLLDAMMESLKLFAQAQAQAESALEQAKLWTLPLVSGN